MNGNEINISERKKQILLMSVEYYINSGEPIASGKLNELGLNFSTATIRNELNSLEELGFLKQLHTSGGRIPTEKGYNAYVLSLASKIPNNPKKLKKIESGFLTKTKYLSDILKSVAKTVSDATNFPSAIMLNGFENFTITSIKIVPLISNQCFVLIETNFGIIDPVFIDIKNIDEKLCHDASACLTSNFKGLTIKSLINEVKNVEKNVRKDLENYKEIFIKVVALLNEYMEKFQNEIVSSGTTSLLEVKELKESEKAKALINFIEEDKEFKEILANNEAEEKFEFKIGSTTQTKDAGGYGLVKTKCVIDGVNIGSVAVVGPQRMDYLKIASALQFITKEFEQSKKGENK